MKKLNHLNFAKTDEYHLNLEKYYANEVIFKFIEQYQISEKDILNSISDFEEYLANPHLYKLIWNYGIELIYQPIKINPGLTYLENQYFSEEKKITNNDLKDNNSLLEVMKKLQDDKDSGLYLQGGNGVGKTHFSAALANLYYENVGEKTLFVFWPEFIEMSKRFGNDNMYYIKRVKVAKRLIIDDLGQESISAWSRDDILHSIISYRLEKNLTTIITSNYNLEELKELYTFKKIEQKKARSLVEKIKKIAREYEITGTNKR